MRRQKNQIECNIREEHFDSKVGKSIHANTNTNTNTNKNKNTNTNTKTNSKIQGMMRGGWRDCAFFPCLLFCSFPC